MSHGVVQQGLKKFLCFRVTAHGDLRDGGGTRVVLADGHVVDLGWRESVSGRQHPQTTGTEKDESSDQWEGLHGVSENPFRDNPFGLRYRSRAETGWALRYLSANGDWVRTEIGCERTLGAKGHW